MFLNVPEKQRQLKATREIYGFIEMVLLKGQRSTFRVRVYIDRYHNFISETNMKQCAR